MRVFISVDMEGIAGIVHAEQTRPHAPEYERSCRLMTAEANAAIEGALAAGAGQISSATRTGTCATSSPTSCILPPS
jgi:D-amino peptidase